MDVQLSAGEAVFRLVRNEPPSERDWQPKYGKGAAAKLGVPELERIGLSHFLTIDAVKANNPHGSMIARVTLEQGRFHWARTGHIEGHIDVWGRADEFPPLAEIVEAD